MYVLENAVVRIEIDDEGAIAKATDLRDGTVHLQGGGKIFRFIVPGGGFDSRAVDSGRQGATGSQDGNVLRMQWDGLKAYRYGDEDELAIKAEVTYRLEDGPDLIMDLAVTNDCPDTIVEVQFPIVGNWTGYAGPGVDALKAPFQKGFPTPDPHKPDLGFMDYTLLESQTRWTANYPIDTAAPWLDLSGGGHGMGIVSLMQVPQLGGTFVRDASGYDRKNHLELGWFSLTGIKQGSTLQLPTVALVLHQGDWHDTARYYRDRTLQWWKPAPLPERLQNTLGFENIVVQDFDGIRYRTWEEIADETIATTTAGTRDVSLWDYLPLGLYHRRDERGLHEYEPEEEARIRAAVAKLREHGHLSHTLLNMRLALPHGTWWDEVGSKAALRLDDNTIKTEAYSCSSRAARYWTPWRGAKSVTLCAGSPEFREYAAEAVGWLMDVGFRAIHVDQPFERMPCSAENHDHTDAGDTQALTIKWVSDVKKQVSQADGDTYLIGEFVDPWAAEQIEVLFCWSWPVSDPDAVLYSLPGITPAWIVDRDYQDALNGFLRGFLLAYVTGGTTMSLSQAPDFVDWISGLASLRERTADFTLNAIFADQDGITFEGPTEARRFIDGRGGSEGVAVVNRTDSAADSVVTLTGSTGSVARWHGKDGTIGDWIDLTDGGGVLTSSLGPLDAGVWEIRTERV